MKKVLFIILGLIVLILLAAAIMPKDYFVERSVTVDKSNDKVFDYVKNLKNQNDYSAWAKMDTNAINTYTGTDGEVGFISAWDSQVEDVGAGEQEIIGMVDGEKIDYEIRFTRPFESTGKSSMITESVSEDQTKVSWSFSGAMPWPMNLMLVTGNMDKMLGNSLQEGLDGLKSIVEAIPDPVIAEEIVLDSMALDSMQMMADEIE